jgi:hypothetical protein
MIGAGPTARYTLLLAATDSTDQRAAYEDWPALKT